MQLAVILAFAMIERFLNSLKNGTAVLNSRQRSILSAAFVLMGMYSLSAVLGFIRNRLLVAVFFPRFKWQTDVYFAAFRIPDLLFQVLVVSALGPAFIPIFSSLLSGKKKERAWKFASNVLYTALFTFFLLVSLTFFSTPFLAKTIAPGFSPQETQLLIKLQRILLFVQGFFVLSAILTGILQCFRRFLLPALAPVVYNLGLIFGIVVLSPSFGIYGPVFGALLGAFLHFLIQLPSVVNLGFKLNWHLDLHDPLLRKVGRLMIPRALSLGVEQIYLTFALALASTMPAGRVALFNFARQICQFPLNLFGSSFGQAVLPFLSSAVARKNISRFRGAFLLSLHQIFYFAIPTSVALLTLRIPFVRLLFGARGFSWEDTIITGWTVAFFSLGLFAQSGLQLVIRGFYAFQDTKTPFLGAVFSTLLNIFLAFFLTKVFNFCFLGRVCTLNSPVGLSLAFSLSSVFNFLFLFLLLDKKVNFQKKEILLPFFQISLSSLLLGLFLWLPMRILDRLVFDTTRTVNLLFLTLFVSLVGFFVYLKTTFALGLKEGRVIFSFLKRLGHLTLDKRK